MGSAPESMPEKGRASMPVTTKTHRAWKHVGFSD